ncbi:hypothetical protein KC320_g27 [Hortaea werneckii]|nr:hypothetical protein KC320_g27 [Hortaea werneckii]
MASLRLAARCWLRSGKIDDSGRRSVVRLIRRSDIILAEALRARLVVENSVVVECNMYSFSRVGRARSRIEVSLVYSTYARTICESNGGWLRLRKFSMMFKAVSSPSSKALGIYRRLPRNVAVQHSFA